MLQSRIKIGQSKTHPAYISPPTKTSTPSASFIAVKVTSLSEVSVVQMGMTAVIRDGSDGADALTFDKRRHTLVPGGHCESTVRKKSERRYRKHVQPALGFKHT